MPGCVDLGAVAERARAGSADDVRLLQRTTRRVNLTEHGARFLQRVRGGLDQIDQAFAELDSARRCLPGGCA
jgi:DNA-binding transcriptional LysR family regulator